VFAASSRLVGVISDAEFHTIVSLDVPPGNYVIWANGFISLNGNSGGAYCRVFADSTHLIDTSAYLDDNEFASIPYSMLATVSLPSSGSVRVTCATTTDGVDAVENVLVAMRVG
jgi:hypothetical protein